MLLVVVARNVRESAIYPTEEMAAEIQTMTAQEADELRERLEMTAEEADWYAENYVLARQQAESELADLQSKLAYAEKETQKIKDELARLEQLADQLDTNESTTPDEVEHLKRLLAQQRRRKAEAELELAELQKDVIQKEKSYAIIPHRGPGGTFRRPIYVECNNDKIIIQPEGIELVPGDFQTLDRPDNPFDTVLRVIRQYYVETGQIVRGSEPYPLMLVRPSGIDMFDKALQATGNWVKEFGYEVVPADWNMQYPEPDAELRRRILQQLEIARSRQNGYLIAMRMDEQAGARAGQGFGGGGQQFRVDHRGNVVPTGGGGIRDVEEIQRLFGANRQGEGDGRRQTADGSRESVTASPGANGAVSSNPTTLSGTPPMEEKNKGHLALHNNSPPSEQNPNSPPLGGAGDGSATGGTGAASMSPMQNMSQNSAQRPQNWALKEATQYTTGLSRYVRIRCESDKFVIASQPGMAKEREIPITDSVQSAADQLVQAIWEFQESWGSAGEKGHWRPILQVRVAPGGEQRLHELKALLRTSGLVIE